MRVAAKDSLRCPVVSPESTAVATARAQASATVVTPGDLHCGWMSRYWAPEKNMEAIKMGINVLMYYLTH